MHREALDSKPRVVPASAVRRLFGRGSVYTLGMTIQMAAAFLVVPVVTRSLAATGYGEVATALVVSSLLAILAAAGLPEAASRTFFQGSSGPRDARRLITGTLVTATGVVVLGELTGPLWAPLLSLHFTGALRLGVLAGAATGVALAVQSYLRAADRVWSFLAVTTVVSVGGQALGLALVIVDGTPTAYLLGITAGTLIGVVVGLALTRAPSAGLPGRDALRQAMGIGLPLVPHSLAIFLLAAADRVAIAAILGLAATGRYQVAYAIGSLGVAVATALNQAWLPLLLGADEGERRAIFATTSRAVHAFGVVLAGLLALGAPIALDIAAPPSFDRAALVPVTAVVAASIVPYVTSSTYFNAAFIAGRTRIMAVAAPAAAAANVALNLALLSAMGLIAAALATVAAYVVLALVVAYGVRRMLSHPPEVPVAPAAWALTAVVVAAGSLLPAEGVVTALLVRGPAIVALLGGAAWWGLRERRPHARRAPLRPLEGRA